jgi:phosphoglycolate phosphatase-like HAD superfamily hydrolase
VRIAFDLDGVLADLDSALIECAERLFGAGAPGDEADEEAETEPAGVPVAADGAGADARAMAAARPAEAAADGAPDAAPAQRSEDAPPDATGDALPAASPSTAVTALTARQQRALWRAVRETENFWESLDEIEPGVIARLATLAQERRWEVIFLTQRPATAGDTCQLQSQRWLGRHGFPYPSVFVVSGSRGRVAAALHLDAVVDDRPENCLDVIVESQAQAILVSRAADGTEAASARRLGIEVVPTVAACLDRLLAREAGTRPGVIGRIKRLLGGDGDL